MPVRHKEKGPTPVPLIIHCPHHVRQHTSHVLPSIQQCPGVSYGLPEALHQLLPGCHGLAILQERQLKRWPGHQASCPDGIQVSQSLQLTGGIIPAQDNLCR